MTPMLALLSTGLPNLILTIMVVVVLSLLLFAVAIHIAPSRAAKKESADVQHRWPEWEPTPRTRCQVAMPEVKPIVTQGVYLIAAERQRQILKKGFDARHDDEHDDGALVAAARSYLDDVQFRKAGKGPQVVAPLAWPWDLKDWKPTEDPTHSLVKAGALIEAELDRRSRLAQARSAKSAQRSPVVDSKK